MEAAQFLERNFTAAGCCDFAGGTACLGRSGSATATATAQPPTLLRAPSEGGQSYAVGWAYGAEAMFADADCGALTLTPTGLRGAGGSVAA